MADEDEEQTRKIPTRQEVRDYYKAQEEAGRQNERAKDELASGSNIVKHEVKVARREADAKQNVFEAAYNNALKRGMSKEEASAVGDQAVTDSGIGSVTPNLDRSAADNRKLAARREAEETAAKNKALKEGLNKFQSDVSKSMTFGEESALLTPEGRQRALKAAVKAGYNFDEADNMVQGAFKKLQEIGKREGWKNFGSNVNVPVAIPPLLARPEENATPAAPAGPPKPEGGPTAPPVPIKNKEGKPEYGPVNLAQDIQQGLGLKNLPEGSEAAVRSAFDALSGLNARYRVTPEEAKDLRERQYKAKLDPAFAEGLAPIEKDIAERTKLYEQYDTARNALIDLIGTEGDFGGGGSVKDGMGRKEIAQNEINRRLRQLREQQYQK